MLARLRKLFTATKDGGAFFVKYFTSPKETILDAAMGMGCETLFLAKQGFNVVGNEIDPNFQKLASMYARRININWKQHPWIGES